MPRGGPSRGYRFAARSLAGLLIAASCVGCSLLPQPGALSATASPQSDAARLIVLTVANPPEPVPSHAGSTALGYDAMPLYAESGFARARIAELARGYHLKPLAEWPIQPLRVHCVVFRIDNADDRDNLLARLSQDPRVTLAQPMQSFDTLTSAYNDPYFGLQRGFAQIDAAQAQQWAQGDGVRVAVIDTGIDGTHPDLQGRIERERDFVEDKSRDFASDRHGTEVAGVIAADANNREGIVGVAPGARILALSACWQVQAHEDGARCNSFTLAQALTIAIDSGARVINLSLGGPADPLLTQLVAYALKRGIVVVGAIPPDGRSDGFPVGVPGVIAVDTAERASGGNALRAPGREVLTLTPGGHYDFVSGSSIAAAHVSGAAALLLQADPNLDAATILRLLTRSSVASEPGAAATINVCAALMLLRPQNVCGTRLANASATP